MLMERDENGIHPPVKMFALWWAERLGYPYIIFPVHGEPQYFILLVRFTQGIFGNDPSHH